MVLHLNGTIFVGVLQLVGAYICGGTSACWGLYLWRYFSLMELYLWRYFSLLGTIFVGVLQLVGDYICRAFFFLMVCIKIGNIIVGSLYLPYGTCGILDGILHLDEYYYL